MVKKKLEKQKAKKRKIGPKTDYFLSQGIEYIDYKNTAILQRFITRQGRIVNHSYTQLTPKSQRQLARAIKRAREMALLLYTIVEQNI